MSQYPPPPPPTKAPWWQRPVALWLTVILVLIAFAVGAAAGAGSKDENRVAASASTTPPTAPTTTTAPQPVVVLDVSGTNKTNTENFSVSGKWSIDAEVSGGAGINVTINDKDGGVQDFVQFDKSGTFDNRGGGTFYLEISDDWSLSAPIGFRPSTTTLGGVCSHPLS